MRGRSLDDNQFELEAVMKTCKRCDLCNSGDSNRIGGSGPKNADILIVGDAPDRSDDELEKPFSGDAGKKLNYLLSQAGLKRKDVRVTHAVRCRPYRNKTPQKKHITSCRKFLVKEIARVKPKVIVALGNVPCLSLLDQAQIRENRGFPFIGDDFDIPIVPTFHPSMMLRDQDAGHEKDDIVIRDLKYAARIALECDGKVPEPDWTDVTVIKTIEDLEAMAEEIIAAPEYSFDIESTKADIRYCKILSLSFSIKPGYAWVLPLRTRSKKVNSEGNHLPKHFWPKSKRKRVIQILNRMFDENPNTIAQNGKFDLTRLRKIGVKVPCIGFDTMIAHHCTNEYLPHNLNFICQFFEFDFPRYEAEILEYTSKKDPHYENIPDEKLWKYGGIDSDVTLRAKLCLDALLDKEKVRKPYETELALAHVLGDMEWRGAKVDIDRLENLGKEFGRKIRLAKKKIAKLAGKDFNPNSPKQMIEFFEENDVELTAKTASGQYSVGADVLERLERRPKENTKLPGLVLKLRKLQKMKSTYLDGNDDKEELGGFAAMCDDHGFIHTSYNPARTVTGRVASSDPNLQNIPRGGLIRNLFVSRFGEDGVLVSVDYSKFELCISAYLAREVKLIKALREGVDIHSLNAAFAYDKDPADVIYEERAVAKSITFGLSYGASAQRIADDYDLDIDVVEEFIESYFQKYSRLRKWRKWASRKARKQGFLRTRYGRKRRGFAPGDRWTNSKQFDRLEGYYRGISGRLDRQAMNFPVQSWGTDLMSEKTVELDEELRRRKLRCCIALTVHDGLVLDCPKDELVEVTALLPEVMEMVLGEGKPYEMPLRIDMELMYQWDKHLTDEESDALANEAADLAA